MNNISKQDLLNFIDNNNTKIVEATYDELGSFYETTVDITMLGETLKLPFDSVSFNCAIALVKIYLDEWFGGTNEVSLREQTE